MGWQEVQHGDGEDQDRCAATEALLGAVCSIPLHEAEARASLDAGIVNFLAANGHGGSKGEALVLHAASALLESNTRY